MFSTDSLKRFEDLLEEAGSLLVMCNIAQVQYPGEDVKIKLTPAFLNHLFMIKRNTERGRKHTLEEICRDKHMLGGLLTLTVVTYLHNNGFSNDFVWNYFAPIVDYLETFFTFKLRDWENYQVKANRKKEE